MNRPEVYAIIPARFSAHRFPGKPLVDLLGLPMVVRVAHQARAASSVTRVVVATEDARILEAARAHGVEAVMTPAECPSGSDRVCAALDALSGPEPALVVNVQGDEPLIDPRDLDVLIHETLARQASGELIGTLARPLELARFADPNTVKVARAQDGRALYFSRAPIPHGSSDPLQHVGIYAFPPPTLARFTRLAPSPLERVERLEQLRALENGIPLHVTMCLSERPTMGVDTPEDVPRVLVELRARELADQSAGLDGESR